MPAFESALSPKWSNDGTVTKSYHVVDVYDDVQAIGQAAAESPPEYHLLLRQGNPEINPIGYGVWEVVFTYKPPQVATEIPPEFGPGEGIVEFDTGGKTIHLTQAPYGQMWWPASAPDIGTDIGLTEGGLEGVDVPIGGLVFQVTRRWNLLAVTGVYAQALAVLTGSVNNAPYAIGAVYAPGELLFLGARGTSRGLPYWEITYTFEAQANRSQIPWALSAAGLVGPIPFKAGHDYLWFLTAKATMGKRAVEYVQGAYVARLFPYLHFPTFLGF